MNSWLISLISIIGTLILTALSNKYLETSLPEKEKVKPFLKSIFKIILDFFVPIFFIVLMYLHPDFDRGFIFATSLLTCVIFFNLYYRFFKTYIKDKHNDTIENIEHIKKLYSRINELEKKLNKKQKKKN